MISERTPEVVVRRLGQGKPVEGCLGELQAAATEFTRADVPCRARGTAGQAGLPEDADVRVPSMFGEYMVWNGSRRQETENCGRNRFDNKNDADFDIQVINANMASSDDPSSGLSSMASVCWQGEKHVRRNQAIDAFRSDCVDIEEREAQKSSGLSQGIGQKKIAVSV